MSEQLNQIQAMLEQLVQMVGHNNAITEELRQRMDGMETKMNRGFGELTNMINLLGEKTDKLEGKINNLDERLDTLQLDVNFIVRKVAEHDTAIIKQARAL